MIKCVRELTDADCREWIGTFIYIDSFLQCTIWQEKLGHSRNSDRELSRFPFNGTRALNFHQPIWPSKGTHRARSHESRRVTRWAGVTGGH